MNKEKVNKILVIRLSSLGDILLTTPVVRALKKHYPSAGIDYLLKAQYKDTMVNNPYLNKIISFHRSAPHKTRTEIIDERYDIIIDLQNNPRSNMLMRGTNAKKFRFRKNSLKKLILVKSKINLMKDLPAIPERYAEAVPGLMLDGNGLDLYSGKPVSAGIIDKKNLIGICPGSRHYTKKWPESYFSELGRMLQNAGYNIILFGGRDDRDICERLNFTIPGSVNLCNDDNLLQTAEDMRQCSLIICNDSGLMHTACAAGTPVVVFYGSTVKEFGFFPYKCKSLIFEENGLTCRPCSHIGRSSCPKGHFKCMLNISPDLVFDKIIQFITTA